MWIEFNNRLMFVSESDEFTHTDNQVNLARHKLAMSFHELYDTLQLTQQRYEELKNILIGGNSCRK